MKNGRDLSFMYNDWYIKGFSNSSRHEPNKRIKAPLAAQIASTCFFAKPLMAS